MKAHPRECKPLNNIPVNPCTLDHLYLCKGCGDEFTTNSATLFADTIRGRVFALHSWPFHNLGCYRTYQSAHPGYTNPQLESRLKEKPVDA